MKRTVITNLLEWKSRKDRKPLVLKGVRQSGKTYLLNQFGREHYESVAYFNFETTPSLAERFEADLIPERIITELGIVRGKKIEPHSTLIIFDEIQFCSRALTALKYFCEDEPDYHVVCAGSLLGIALSKPSSFPVGKVEFMTLFPMSFYEFVLAHDEMMLLEYLDHPDRGMTPPAQIFTEKLNQLLNSYFITGGMPEVVAKWIETKNLDAVERIQDNIINSYELDFSKHAPLTDFPKISAIWRSIPDQLAKESGKFMYGHAKKGARAKDLEDALEWLIRAGMVHKVCLVDKPSVPLSAYTKPNFFKIYMADIGILRRMCHLPASAFLDDGTMFKEFKGAITENYVLNELLANEIASIYYWASGNTAEVDFLVQQSGQILPIEVKASINVKSRSLALYRGKYKPFLAIRISKLDLKLDDGLLNIPLHMIWKFHKLVNKLVIR